MADDNQWDEILYSWYREQDRFHDKLKNLDIDWKQPTFEEEQAMLRARIAKYRPLCGLSRLSSMESQELSGWIETRIHDEVRRAIDACLKRFLM